MRNWRSKKSISPLFFACVFFFYWLRIGVFSAVICNSIPVFSSSLVDIHICIDKNILRTLTRKIRQISELIQDVNLKKTKYTSRSLFVIRWDFARSVAEDKNTTTKDAQNLKKKKLQFSTLSASPYLTRILYFSWRGYFFLRPKCIRYPTKTHNLRRKRSLKEPRTIRNK